MKDFVVISVDTLGELGLSYVEVTDGVIQDTIHVKNNKRDMSSCFHNIDGKSVLFYNTGITFFALKDLCKEFHYPYPKINVYSLRHIAQYLLFDGAMADQDTALCMYGGPSRWAMSYEKVPYLAKLAVDCFKHEDNNVILSPKSIFWRGCMGGIHAESKDSCGYYYKFHSNSANDFLKTLKPIDGQIDTNNYFYGKSVCFTGQLSFGRKYLMEKVNEVGGVPTNSVTQKTDILVVGIQTSPNAPIDGISAKQEKALKIQEDGGAIEIMDEHTFWDFLELKSA